jgi:hypothetical protein
MRPADIRSLLSGGVAAKNDAEMVRNNFDHHDGLFDQNGYGEGDFDGELVDVDNGYNLNIII